VSQKHRNFFVVGPPAEVVYPDYTADLTGQYYIFVVAFVAAIVPGTTIVPGAGIIPAAGILCATVITTGILARIDAPELSRAAPESQYGQEHEKCRFHRCKS
jgi:hypothetical protein